MSTDQIPARHGAWSSGLSTNDFAAMVESGIEPLGFVQGVSVVSWNFAGLGFRGGLGGFSAYGQGSGGGYSEQFYCPHGYVSAEHRGYGMNYEKTWIEQTWVSAFQAAFDRLIGEASALGAAGIIDIKPHTEYHSDSYAFEYFLSGTAVAVEGAPVPERPFTTFLAGQKLSKLVEAGFSPVSIAMSFVSIGVYANCVTEYQLNGGNWTWGVQTGEIDQVTRAHGAARELARERVRRQLGSDSLHAAHLAVNWRESVDGPQIEVTLQGNRVRRFKPFTEMAPPRPVLRLSD